MRTTLVFVGGAIAGTLVTLLVLSLLRTDAFRATTLSGPVAVVDAKALRHGHLGVMFSNEPSRSLYVADVMRRPEAGEAAVSVGDRVTSLNATTVSSVAEVNRILSGMKPGEFVELGILRGQQPMTLKLRLMSADQVVAVRTQSGPRAP